MQKVKTESPSELKEVLSDKWESVWRQGSFATFGIDQAYHDGKKYYRAVAAGGMTTFESDIYEAVDGADLPSMGFENGGQRDKLVFEAAMVRAHMTPSQKSYGDMREIAGGMLAAAGQAYHAWEREKEIRKEQEAAAEQLTHWLTSLKFLIEQGTPEQKETLVTLVSLFRGL